MNAPILFNILSFGSTSTFKLSYWCVFHLSLLLSTDANPDECYRSSGFFFSFLGSTQAQTSYKCLSGPSPPLILDTQLRFSSATTTSELRTQTSGIARLGSFLCLSPPTPCHSSPDELQLLVWPLAISMYYCPDNSLQ